ncbi:MAG: DUF929 domain-containing protein [Candidatus Marsarchaeota archaeon]|nr:DUF929 domain-containing protein [Candidatus Marsarchaeota archaeon]
MARRDKQLATYRKMTYLNTATSLAAIFLVVVLVAMVSYQGSTITALEAQVSVLLSATPNTISGLNNANASTGTLAGINAPLNATELSYINNEPLSYYEIAGEKLLNGTLTNEVVLANSPMYNAIVIGGKPSVIYVGAVSCIFCGENRWAMALALAKFGNFSALYNGYSALGDGDVPTLYWRQVNTTVNEGVAFGNYYSSKYINFFSSEYESPITGGFEVQPISYFLSKAPNATYTRVLDFMNSTGKFGGTPFTYWGTSLVTGADAIDFGNTTPSGASNLPIAHETHYQILSQFHNFNDQFAWTEYAGADIYIAKMCPAINNTAPVCKLQAISVLEELMHASANTTTTTTANAP